MKADGSVKAERTAGEVFSSIDTDGDGTITRAEFAPYYEKLKAQVYRDVEAKQRQDSKIGKLRGRSKALLGGIGAAALFLLISILLNFAMVFGVVDSNIATSVPSPPAATDRR